MVEFLFFTEFIQLTVSIDAADSVLTFDPSPVGHHVTYRWTLAPATSSSVNNVTLSQNFTSQPTVGAYKQHSDLMLSHVISTIIIIVIIIIIIIIIMICLLKYFYSKTKYWLNRPLTYGGFRNMGDASFRFPFH